MTPEEKSQHREKMRKHLMGVMCEAEKLGYGYAMEKFQDVRTHLEKRWKTEEQKEAENRETGAFFRKKD